MTTERKAGGRPPKYEGPSRPITVTLPESTLRTLEAIDPDRGKAIVKLARSAAPAAGKDAPLVEVVDIARQAGVIVVGPSAALRRIPFLHLVEVAPARYLLALDGGHDFRTLELALNDEMADLGPDEADERRLIEQLLAHIREVRRSELGKSAEILLVGKKNGARG